FRSGASLAQIREEPSYPSRLAVFAIKAPEPINPITEIYKRTIAKLHQGVGANGGAKFPAHLKDSDILALGQINPQVRTQSCRRDTLQDGPAHPRYLKPYFLRSERVYKPCERRKLSWSC